MFIALVIILDGFTREGISCLAASHVDVCDIYIKAEALNTSLLSLPGPFKENKQKKHTKLASFGSNWYSGLPTATIPNVHDIHIY